ncbi:MAG: tetratricopeptide repeat protein, partial [Acidobacteriota bacterium]|nr:tetratricopeptide repeat protein [Acidobacteriota bacterium]
PSDAGRTFAPAIEPRSAGEPLAAMIEAYLPLDADRRSVEASLEVLRDEQSPAIASFPMPMATTQHADIAAMQAVLDTSVLPAGAYLARASVSYAGKGIGTALRPFRVDRSLASAETPTVPPVLAASMVRALPAFDHKDLFSPAVTTAALGAAAARGTAATDAVKTAQSGDFAAAAMAALLSGDQALGAFLKGLDLLQRGDAARAATQFQVAMSAAPDFVPARVYLGASLATASRHREAAGLLQSGATAAAPALIGRLAGEEWLRAGEFTRAIDLLTHAVARSDGDPHTQKALGLAYVMANRPAEALAALGAYLERRVDDPDVLLAGIYAAYARHAAGAQPTLAADRRLAQTWLKAYQAAGGTLPLPTAWVTYLDALR